MWNLALVALLCALGCIRATETPHTRKYFYVGGEYVTNSYGQHFFKDQVYVEELTPVGGATKPVPLVLIHGMGQTGTVGSRLTDSSLSPPLASGLIQP